MSDFSTEIRLSIGTMFEEGERIYCKLCLRQTSSNTMNSALNFSIYYPIFRTQMCTHFKRSHGVKRKMSALEDIRQQEERLKQLRQGSEARAAVTVGAREKDGGSPWIREVCYYYVLSFSLSFDCV